LSNGNGAERWRLKVVYTSGRVETHDFLGQPRRCDDEDLTHWYTDDNIVGAKTCDITSYLLTKETE
jgi:hypothetical protein